MILNSQIASLVDPIRLIRYPGGKQRILQFILPYLPSREMIKGKYIEPFLGSGAVFFALNPYRAVLSDINRDLIDLFRGVKRYPREIWRIYVNFPKDKASYYRIRDKEDNKKGLAFRAAKLLYLNRTCFKGMWRQNSDGKFNIGYGGLDRVWVINEESLNMVSKRLKKALLICSDFEETIEKGKRDDFIFLDPPYKPGAKDLLHSHYLHNKFRFEDYVRLAKVLERASDRGVKWAMTISSHPEILKLFKIKSNIYKIPKGTGKRPGSLIFNSGEVLICNY